MGFSVGHLFSVGDAPNEANRMDINQNRLNRWELCCRLKQEFWSKWSNDYITNLQKRVKWTEKKESLEIGDMVLVLEEGTTPLKWPIGRVEKSIQHLMG